MVRIAADRDPRAPPWCGRLGDLDQLVGDAEASRSGDSGDVQCHETRARVSAILVSDLFITSAVRAWESMIPTSGSRQQDPVQMGGDRSTSPCSDVRLLAHPGGLFPPPPWRLSW